jgi:hypothetical protein
VTQDGWGAEGKNGRVKFLPLAWAWMPKTSFRKNSDSLDGVNKFFCGEANDEVKLYGSV